MISDAVIADVFFLVFVTSLRLCLSIDTCSVLRYV